MPPSSTVAMFLAGGGSPEQEAQVWAAAFDGVGTVVHWPFALSAEQIGSAQSWFRTALDSRGLAASVSTWASLDGHEPAELADAELLFVGGGTTSTLVEHIRGHGFAQAVIDHVRGGGRYYGGSAGAVLVCESVTVASLIDDDAPAQGMAGLGLLRGFTICPHANTYPVGTAHRLAAQLGHDVIALPEASGIRVEGSLIEPIGPDHVRVARPDGSTTALR